MNLLDLQQKEESLNKVRSSNELARLARKQADETEAQSQILLLFTIVTIVFVSHTQASTALALTCPQLPLSFFTSYFGMNVVEFTGESGNTNQKEVWKVTGPASSGIIAILLIIAWMLYNNAKKRRATRSGGTSR